MRKKLPPHFSVNLLSPEKSFQWCIALNGEVIHHISNFVYFSKAVGYPNLHQKFINDKVVTFHVAELSNEDKSDTCLQKRIVWYLFENCREFKNEYGMYYASVIEECKAISAEGKSKCEDCYILKQLN